MPRGDRPALTIEERLERKSAPGENGCVLWTGHLMPDGYGRMMTGSRKDGSRRAKLTHRAIWEEKFGPIPDGLEINHKCFTRNCWNTDHLEVVTRSENVRYLSPEGAAAKSAWARELAKLGQAALREQRMAGIG